MNLLKLSQDQIEQIALSHESELHFQLCLAQGFHSKDMFYSGFRLERSDCSGEIDAKLSCLVSWVVRVGAPYKHRPCSAVEDEHVDCSKQCGVGVYFLSFLK